MNILITGGSSGIGQQLVVSLSRDNVVTAPDRLHLDLARLPDYPMQTFDCIILCAGSDLGGKQPFCAMQDSDWVNTMQVNLVSNMKLIKDYIIARGSQWSKIIVFGSTATNHIWPNMIPYSLSKLALEEFCCALRQEVSSNIGISIIRPGLVKTNFNFARNKGHLTQQQANEWYADKSHLLPHDLVPAVKYMLDDRLHIFKELVIEL
jgi:NADP-dependent 3-hydroxy acid dehydrogenase YdfG